MVLGADCRLGIGWNKSASALQLIHTQEGSDAAPEKEMK